MYVMITRDSLESRVTVDVASAGLGARSERCPRCCGLCTRVVLYSFTGTRTSVEYVSGSRWMQTWGVRHYSLPLERTRCRGYTRIST